ncbi:MAG TPA: sigma-70 family RNA polymerase sigma factor [Solirubrobacterales bacterium]|nr:sigma-70 family RNA polymerase sigma factor [Solirubrobacterales bacterium]
MYANSAEQSRDAQVQALAERLYRERYPYLLRIAAKNAPSHADAEEAVSEAFASFIRAFDPDGEAPPLAWVTLTVKRECWDRYRRLHLDRSAGQEADRAGGESGSYIEAIPSRAGTTEQQVVEVDEARTQLAALKPAERRTLSLLAAGYSYAEVGEITGFSFTKINRCAAEGRARLRELTAT